MPKIVLDYYLTDWTPIRPYIVSHFTSTESRKRDRSSDGLMILLMMIFLYFLLTYIPTCIKNVPEKLPVPGITAKIRCYDKIRFVVRK